MIKRRIEQEIKHRLQPGKVVLLFGARRVGKTFLMREIINGWTEGPTMLLNGEDSDTLALLSEQSSANYHRLFDNVSLLGIDEAQNIPDIGKKLKLIVDEMPEIRVMASGSSSFDLLNKTGEPLVGRSSQLTLSPIAQAELQDLENALQVRQNLETRLLYGYYPEVVLMSNNQERVEYLRNLVSAYLLKDVLSIDGIRNSSKMQDLLRLLAYQLGSEVSYDELGRQLGMSKNTIEKYLDLLTKVFVVYRIPAYAKNLRKEVRKSAKYYFYDVGIRNAIINNFQPLSLREGTETGHLWENYLINERIKKHFNACNGANFYMWRTYDQQEIDLIEEDNGQLKAFEFKWGEKNSNAPMAFAKSYPHAVYQTINRTNYLDFVL